MNKILIYEKLNTGSFPINVRKFVNHCSENRMHWHEEIELLYFTKGSAKISCNLQEHTVKQGDILFINGKELHTGAISRDETNYYCIHIDTRFFNNFIEDEFVIYENIIEDRECCEILDTIIEKYGVGGYKNTVRIIRLIYELLDILTQKYVKSVMSEADYKKNFKKLDKLNPVIEYINNHYEEELTVTGLANRFYMSPSYFAHFFKNKTQKSVVEYINEVKIKHAKAFLEKTDMTISEIATATGFNDTNYFARKFKAITGVTPSRYKSNSNS